MGKGYGNRLAGGGVKASFPATEPGITQEKFDDALADFDPKEYLRKAEAAENEARELRKLRIQAEEAEAIELDKQREQRRRDPDPETPGNVGFDFGENIPF
jgi:hypothetical protein